MRAERHSDNGVGILQEQVQAAHASGSPLRIRGGGSKDFYGREIQGEVLDTRVHRGLVHYLSSELFITARAGTPLREIEAWLAERQQFLPFEPPHFTSQATLGGAVAAGLSGPRRPYVGAVRDYVLGVTLLNGRGEILKFGGEVMKNVAGFDLARLMAGSLGTLGVLLEVSLKVLPRPECEETRVLACTQDEAIARLARWGRTSLPISAALHDGTALYIRLSGTDRGLAAARDDLGGDVLADADPFWQGIREQTHPFFQQSGALWRLSVPPATPPLSISGPCLLDWGGAQRWIRTDASVDLVRAAARAAGGHATLFRGGDSIAAYFHPLPPALLAMQQNLKQALDPKNILNPGRLYPGL